MLQEIVITPATAVILVVVAGWAAWAIRRLLRRGMCDCGDKCGDCVGCSAASRPHARGGLAGAGGKRGAPACAHCSAAEAMVANVEGSLEGGRRS